MTETYKKLIATLEEIFQLDQADLDFGIYRIMNQKRTEINDFLQNRLLSQVKETLASTGANDSEAIKRELDEILQKAREMGVAEPDNLPKVIDLRGQYLAAGSPEAMANDVFSHLTSFFRRYYRQGDFISQRRYKKDVYAIPYEGEEVKLYWANHDQYYIKTSENFRNYSFKIDGGKTVNFRLRDANTEQNNNKTQQGKERKFKLIEEDILDAEGNSLNIWFTYEPQDKKVKQGKLNEEAFETIKPLIPEDYRQGLLKAMPTAKNPGRTLLEKHLNDYTARNTFDYFIHKDLGGFLSRELDFFIKNEILVIDDINLDAPQSFDRQLRVVKAFKTVAGKIIALLAQLENFQKKLWLKKKMVVQADYCITLDRIPENFYPDIATNQAQHVEWVRLFAIDEIQGDLITPAYSNPLSIEFLKANPFLVLDTKFFNREWKYKLLATIENIDEQCDGLLINSENFQAINLLLERFTESIQCIHIDPPYNTETSGFLYKNNYRHSTWMSMMYDRITLSAKTMSASSSIGCHIDENEYERLWCLFRETGLNNVGTVVWDKRNPMTGGGGIATQHEYIIWQSKNPITINVSSDNARMMIEFVDNLIKQHGSINDNLRREFSQWINQNDSLSGGEKAYRYIDDEGRIYQSVSLRAPEPRTDPKFFAPLIHPVTKKPCAIPPNGFSRTPDTLKKMEEEGFILFGIDETVQPRQKMVLSLDNKRQMTSLIQNGAKGKNDTDKLGIYFPYCHPVSLYMDLIGSTTQKKHSITIDFFAGSGTSGHAIINLNRNDNGERNYILVEVGEYFESVTKPRIQKVIYSEDWRDGKPVSRNGSSHCFKYMRLESYEDTLNNLQLHRTDQQQALLTQEYFGEEYLLHYMLDVESRDSLLNLDMFKRPFGYKLKVTENNELNEQEVDLVETFNYLIGLAVKSMEIIRGNVVVQGSNLQGEKILVIWRDVEETNNQALNEFFRKLNINTRDTEFKRIYVNGDNNLENIRMDDEQWKVVLIEEEFHKRMFDTKDV